MATKQKSNNKQTHAGHMITLLCSLVSTTCLIVLISEGPDVRDVNCQRAATSDNWDTQHSGEQRSRVTVRQSFRTASFILKTLNYSAKNKLNYI